MNVTMTSLPVVPSKFYQVCRLCLAVVSDTNDLMNLSVFGRHNASYIGSIATSAQTNSANEDNMVVTASTNSSSSVSGVIVKTTNRKISSPTNENLASNSVTNNVSDNEAAACGEGTTIRGNGSSSGGGGDDDNNNFKIDGDLHQADILERIYTFLSITVSSFHCSLLLIMIIIKSIAYWGHVHIYIASDQLTQTLRCHTQFLTMK